MRKRAVITLHGIRTRGEWQKSLTPTLANYDLVPYPFDYGNFNTFQLCCPVCRKAIIKRFREEYYDICARARVKRPSIVAHSFGSYIIGWLLKNDSHILFDKVILAGSILPKDFKWHDIFAKEQVLAVHNEVATRDIWPRICKYFVSESGDSGTKGFECKRAELTEDTSEIGHSDTFFSGHYDEWGQFLSSPRYLSSTDKNAICQLLEFAIYRASSELNLKPEKVRASIFLPIGNNLEIPEGAYYNDCSFFKDNNVSELKNSIPIGFGGTGLAFQKRRIYKTILRPDQKWFMEAENETESEPYRLKAWKTHPDLKWIFSFPLINSNDGRVFGVMNIDGLDDGNGLMNNYHLTNSVETIIEELEERHVPAMARQFCKHLETGGF